ncbi:hypothetical protein [Nonomuraea basaltis]|uniref:hypothetical protein n=1 Tax=Nonomuraea basaltis TaxID=2495887 RepID=UPI00110C4657|nr:hypothetical protein [Nonomuraea basaltis]TMR90507.1 hypothetical protein EJK15_54980 [Nonomuraea basaltis]
MSRSDMTDDELAAWKARKDAGRAQAHAAEMQIALLLRDNPEGIDGFRIFCARMNPYSIRNCMRIYGQNPDAAHVQPRFFWGGYGRQVEPDAAVWIIAPKVERKFTKEVENKQTGQVEEVEDGYKIWPVEDVFPAQATAPKNAPCPFCDTPEGERCPESCPVMQPQAGVPPTREDVAEALAAVLKQVGGFDPSALSGLGQDPMQDSYGDPYETPGVRWETIAVTKGAAKWRKPGTRRYRFIHSVDLDRPGVRYTIAGLGVIWISPYELRSDSGGDAPVTIQYGDDVTADRHWDSRYHHAGPHAPIINAIKFAGTSIVYPHDENWRWFAPHREGHGTVPEKTAEQMGQIVRQLLDHYRGLVEYDAIEEAGFKRRADRRAREAEHEVARLSEREQELAQQRADAERCAAEHRHQAANPAEL